MSEYRHIVRTNSFFWDDPLQDLDENTVVDNGGFVIASKQHSLFENPEDTWVPYVINNGHVLSSGVSVNGRVYWFRSMAETVQTWVELNIIERWMACAHIQLMAMLFAGSYAWDLNYHFPCLYLPLVSVNSVQSANVMSFVTQFPSYPHVEEIIATSESVHTVNSTFSSDMSDILLTFAWERLDDNDVIDEDVDFGDRLVWE